LIDHQHSIININVIVPIVSQATTDVLVPAITVRHVFS